jgi:GntR family transcriptional repressor for pyruvate dehydrogenase complex
LDYQKVHEVRRLLEVEIAGRAAERRTDDDLAKIEEILEAMAALQGNVDELARKDVAFHTALAHATHNELFVVLLDSVVDVMIQVRQMGISVRGSRQYALEAHRQIYEQVKAGNVEGARQTMAAHIAQSETIFRQALALFGSQGD